MARMPKFCLIRTRWQKGLNTFPSEIFRRATTGIFLPFRPIQPVTGNTRFTSKTSERARCWRTRSSATTSSEWSNDGKYLFVGQEDPISKRSDKIWRHTVGTDKNELIFEEKDLLFNAGVGRSRDRKMLFIGSYAKTMREYRYLATDDPLGQWKVVSPAPRRA